MCWRRVGLRVGRCLGVVRRAHVPSLAAARTMDHGSLPAFARQTRWQLLPQPMMRLWTRILVWNHRVDLSLAYSWAGVAAQFKDDFGPLTELSHYLPSHSESVHWNFRLLIDFDVVGWLEYVFCEIHTCTCTLREPFFDYALFRFCLNSTTSTSSLLDSCTRIHRRSHILSP